MELDEKDIESLAKSRVARQENNTTNYWIIGSVAAIIVGVFVNSYSRYIGWGLSIAGVIAFVWYMNNLSKKQVQAAQQLLAEWQAEKQVKE